MAQYKLLVGPSKLEIDTAELGDVSLNLSIKDINNFGKRNASFSKPISVFHTKNTDLIFKSLFNINSANGYNAAKKIYGELIEDGLSVLKGSIQVTDITPNTYEIVLYDNFINLFTELGDKLIVGNIDASLDLQYDPSLYAHTLSRGFIQNQLKTVPTLDGSGYIYPLIDYNGLLNDASVLTNTDYPVLPALAAKQIFDKILSDNGYSYSMSTDIEDVFKKIYIPTNENYNNLITNWNFAYFIEGAPEFVDWNFVHSGRVDINDASLYWWRILDEDATQPEYVELLNRPLTSAEKAVNSARGNQQIPNFALKGIAYDTGCFNLVNQGSGGTFTKDDTYQFGYRIPSDGEYNFDFSFKTRRETTQDASIWLYNAFSEAWQFYESLFYVPSNADGTHPVSQGVTYKLVVNDLSETYDICNVVIDASRSNVDMRAPLRPYYNTGSINNISIKKDTIVYVVVHPDDIDLVTTEIPIGSVLPMRPCYDASTFCKIRKVGEYVNKGTTWNMTSMLPKNYKQSDLVNDVFKTFNAYVTFDQVGQKKLYIKSYGNFFSNPSTFDWSNNLIEDSVKFIVFKNQAPKRFVFSLNGDGDYYNDDFKNWKNTVLYTNTLVNDSDFVESDENITLSYAATALKDINNGLYISKIFDKDNNFKTDWNYRFLFFNSTDFNYKYGIIDDASANVTKWNILSPKMYNDVSGTNVMLSFNSKYTYLSNLSEETNRNLYNLYYKTEIETTFDDDFKILTAKMRLSASDITNFNFNSIIFISNKNIGTAKYRVNSIKNYNTNTNVCDVELLKIII